MHACAHARIHYNILKVTLYMYYNTENAKNYMLGAAVLSYCMSRLVLAPHRSDYYACKLMQLSCMSFRASCETVDRYHSHALDRLDPGLGHRIDIVLYYFALLNRFPDHDHDA